MGVGVVSHYGLHMGLRGARELAEARRPLDPVYDRYGPIYSGYHAARLKDPYDPTIPRQRAGQLFVVARDLPRSYESWQWLSLGVQQLEVAIERDPYQPSLRRALARACEEKAEFLTPNDNVTEHVNKVSRRELKSYLLSAIAAAKEALGLYPNDPDGLIFLAEIEEKAGAFDDQYRSSAREHYQRALELDGQRAWFESIRKFSDRKKADIQSRIARLTTSLEVREVE